MTSLLTASTSSAPYERYCDCCGKTGIRLFGHGPRFGDEVIEVIEACADCMTPRCGGCGRGDCGVCCAGCGAESPAECNCDLVVWCEGCDTEEHLDADGECITCVRASEPVPVPTCRDCGAPVFSGDCDCIPF